MTGTSKALLKAPAGVNVVLNGTQCTHTPAVHPHPSCRLCFSHVSDHKLEAAATAAAARVVMNSASLAAVSFVDQGYETSPPLILSDLLAAGLASGLASRLRELTGIRVQAACALQQLQALRQCTSLTNLDISGGDLQDCPALNLAAALQAMPGLTCLHLCSCILQSQRVAAALG